jgi:hypothetical protein
LLALLAISINQVVSLIRGNKTQLQIEKCGLQDWLIFGLFTVMMFILSYVGLKINRKE